MAAESSLPVPPVMLKVCSEIHTSKIEIALRPKWVPPTQELLIRGTIDVKELKKKNAKRTVEERRTSPSRYGVMTSKGLLSIKRISECTSGCGGSRSCKLIDGVYFVSPYKTGGEKKRCINLHPYHQGICYTREMNPENFRDMQFSPFAPVPKSWMELYKDEYPSDVFVNALFHCYTSNEIRAHISDERFRLLDRITVDMILERISSCDLHDMLREKIESTQ